MDIVLKGITIIDPSSPFHQQTTDIFIQNGFIAEIGSGIDRPGTVIARQGLHVSPGFIDVFAHFGDPGAEAAETAETGSLAAAYGGYTAVFLVPNTEPAAHTKGGIDYLVQKSRNLPVDLYPLGAVTRNAEGKELAEMYDMQGAGAVAFSDGLCPLQSAGMVLKALQYLKAVNKVLVQLPADRSIAPGGAMNEGVVSTRLGLPGSPAIGEELMIARDIELAAYTGGRLHITGISTAAGIGLVRKGKAAGLDLTCSVTPYHLFFTDNDLAGYDTSLKVSPVLRTERDREALKAAVLDGTVDCIASHHLPLHPDQKLVEFEYARHGMIGLETCFAAVRTALPGLPLERLVQLMATAPARIFDLPPATIAVDGPASLSLFLPDEAWTPAKFYSRSANSAFTGRPLRGLALGIIHKDSLFLKP